MNHIMVSVEQVTAILGIESPFEVVDGQSTGLEQVQEEQLEEGVFIKIVAEDYDVGEVITF